MNLRQQPEIKLIQTFVSNNDSENHTIFSQQEDQSYRDLQALRSVQQIPKKTTYVGGGFGGNMDDIIGFDNNFTQNYRESQYQNKTILNNQQTIGSVSINQRMTITNAEMMRLVQNELDSQYGEDLNKEVTQKISKWVAWFILFYYALNGSMIPPWILSIPAEKYLRIAWRFFMQALLLVPFVMYEKRTSSPIIQSQYKFWHIMNPKNLKSIYLTSFGNSLWFTMVLFGFEWTYISHSLNLASLQLFFMSIMRKKENKHSYEQPGQLMIVFGILLMLSDSYSLDVNHTNPVALEYKMTKYIYRTIWQRMIFGDLAALSVSYIMTKFVDTNKNTNTNYPPHLRMFIISIFNTLNMTMSSYFLSGTDIFRDTFWGWFGLFSSVQFSGFLFMSIILGLGSFISSIFLGKLFQPLDIQTAQSFEPIISTLLINLVGVQYLPGPLACIGYVFILPGLFFINVGQHLKTLEEVKQVEISMPQRVTIMKDIMGGSIQEK